MITLLAPSLAGLAAAVLAVPIAVHLWSRRPARVVAVGSTRLLTGARPSQARRLALTDLPLLALRLLLIGLAGLAALGLAWRAPHGVPTRLALLTPGDPAAATRADSLRAAGWTVRWLRPGLPVIAGPASPDAAAATPVWPLLQDAITAAPDADSVLVLAPLTAAMLGGARPAVPFATRLVHTSIRQPEPGDLTLCMTGTAAPRDVQRLGAALEAIATAAHRTAKMADAPCPITLQLDAAPTSRMLAKDTASGIWHLRAGALGDPAVVDTLARLLLLREREGRELRVSPAAAAPHLRRASLAAAVTAWARPLALLALLLLVAERLLAARRAGVVFGSAGPVQR